MSALLSSPRVAVHIADGFSFLSQTPPDTFDVIITDCSDPDGPAAPLFSARYFALAHAALKDGLSLGGSRIMS